MCEFSGTYNSRKYTAKQLKNTFQLINENSAFIFATATVWKYEDINKLDFAPIESAYRKKYTELKSLDIVKSPYWENVRQKKLKEMETYYLLSKATMASYKTPQVLFDYPFAETCKTKYAKPLGEGGDALLNIWETVNTDSRKNNADPNRMKRTFEQQKDSPDALKYAVVEVTAFGWWNCANALIDQGEDPDILENNFRKLFIRTKTIECEEP